MSKYKHRGVCYRECYWKNNLWKPGEIYEGDDPPGKYFNTDGKDDNADIPAEPGLDKRSTQAMRDLLHTKYNSSPPKSWSRKKVWQRLNELEIAEAKDAAPNPIGRPPAKKK